MEKTTAQAMKEQFEKNRTERDLHRYMQYFTEKWSPEDHQKAAEFHADFLAVVQTIHRDALQPMTDALTQAFCAAPITPFVPIKDSA